MIHLTPISIALVYVSMPSSFKNRAMAGSKMIRVPINEQDILDGDSLGARLYCEDGLHMLKRYGTTRAT